MVRLATNKDVNDIYRLLCQLEESTFDESAVEEIVQRDLKNTAHACFVYEKDKHVIGFLHTRIETQWHHMAKVMEIMELIVDADNRSLGVGAALVEAARQLAQQENVVHIELTTNIKRKRAHQFYEHLDFAQTSYKYVKEIK